MNNTKGALTALSLGVAALLGVLATPASADPQPGGSGFILPASEIIPVGKDLLPAAVFFLETVLTEPL
ncbi:hypothetical protein ACFWBB_29720 [Streptomyces sp. NPDC060000]|uniref:hypothetical protein n=1 Tax=Streptomyces sp. NPDC060000 TaxID=3347031 RepID=UPI0036B89B3E